MPASSHERRLGRPSRWTMRAPIPSSANAPAASVSQSDVPTTSLSPAQPSAAAKPAPARGLRSPRRSAIAAHPTAPQSSATPAAQSRAIGAILPDFQAADHSDWTIG